MAALAPPRPPGRGVSPLEALVQNFDRQPAVSRAEIINLLERDPREFYDGAIQVLKNGGPARAVQQVTALIVSSGMIQQALSEPGLSFEQAIALGRLALQIKPSLDVTIARQLAEDATGGNDGRSPARLLDVLAAISSGSRITSLLMRLVRHHDPMLRSKAVLLIGRNSGVKWVQSRLAESDPRTRASAVEALWGFDSTEARDLLRTATRDGNNRVAGNAMIALFRQGDTWVMPELMKMAGTESALSRASAAWVMGETGDPRFREALAKLVGESDAMVRRRAFLALSRLKSATQARAGHEWRVAGRALPMAENRRQVRVEVAAAEGESPILVPTQFSLFEDGKPVFQYQVEEKPLEEAIALTVLLPRSRNDDTPAWMQGVNTALHWKRAGDLWQILHYLAPSEAQGGAASQEALPTFLDDRDAIAAAAQPAAKLNGNTFWNSIQRCVQAANGPADAVRHVIAILTEPVEAPSDLAPIVAAATEAHTAVHAITQAPCPSLEDLCRRTEGTYRTSGSDLELASLIEETNLATMARFHISYVPPAPGGSLLTVRACNQVGSGETSLPLA